MIGLRIKEERARLGFNQPDFAALANASKRTLIDWEKGVSSPTASQLSAFAQIGVDVQYVVTGLRSANVLPADESLILEKFRSADPDQRNKMLMLLLGVSTDKASNSDANAEDNSRVHNQLNGKKSKIDKRNQSQTNNFNGNFGGDYVNGDKH